jgi:hypothetical protein
MRSSLPNNNAMDFTSTFGTRFSCTLINSKEFLIVPASIHPIDACTTLPDPLSKSGANTSPKGTNLFEGQAVTSAKWVETSSMKSFIGVDIPQTRNKGLIHQQGF